jgi:single-strand DNA-binding protein
MSRGTLNRAMLIGRIGKEPQMRYTPNGTPIASLTIATNEAYKDKTGKMQYKTDWHRVVAWRKLAEICGQYLKKGSLVCIEGQLKTRAYEDKSGSKKYITEIVAQTMQMLGSRDHSEKADIADAGEHETSEEQS